MSGPVRDAIAEMLAALPRTAPPGPPHGYGSDLWCERDLAPDGRELDGVRDWRLLLAQAIRRRLDCPRGALPGASDYGLDLRAFLNRGTARAEINELAGRIRKELAKDDRIDRITVTVTPSPTGSEMRIDLRVVPADVTREDFALVLAVTSAAVVLEAIRGGAS